MRIALKSHTDPRSGTRVGVGALAACLLALVSSVPLIAFADQEQAAPAASTEAPAEAAPAAAAPAAAPAPTAPYLAKFSDISSGDTAWMLTSTALVLMMTIPGLGAFLCGYGAQEERSRDVDAKFCHHRASEHSLVGRRLFHCLHARQHRLSRWFQSRIHERRGLHEGRDADERVSSGRDPYRSRCMRSSRPPLPSSRRR